jgi:hypothetical protein
MKKSHVIYGVTIGAAAVVAYKTRKIHRALVETGTYTSPSGRTTMTYTKNGLIHNFKLNVKIPNWVANGTPEWVLEKIFHKPKD